MIKNKNLFVSQNWNSGNKQTNAIVLQHPFLSLLSPVPQEYLTLKKWVMIMMMTFAAGKGLFAHNYRVDFIERNAQHLLCHSSLTQIAESSSSASLSEFMTFFAVLQAWLLKMKILSSRMSLWWKQKQHNAWQPVKVNCVWCDWIIPWLTKSPSF